MSTTRTKTIFWVSVALLAVLLTVASALAMQSLGLVFGDKNWGRYGGDAVVPCSILAVVLVFVLFRRLGLVESEEKIETLHRSFPVAPVRLDASVELRTPRSSWMALAVLMTIIAILIFTLVLLLPAVPGTKPMGYGVALFFALFSLGPWYGYVTHAGLIVCVDEDGIRGDFLRPKSSVRWGRIATCEITTVPQPWGNMTRYTFRDTDGNTLTQLILSPQGDDQQRFLAALHQCFA